MVVAVVEDVVEGDVEVMPDGDVVDGAVMVTVEGGYVCTVDVVVVLVVDVLVTELVVGYDCSPALSKAGGSVFLLPDECCSPAFP